MVQQSATMEQTHEMQLGQLYDVRLSTLHETGPMAAIFKGLWLWLPFPPT